MRLNTVGKIYLFYSLFFLLLANLSYGHVGEHDSIALLSEQITDDPENAELYFKRASQHRYAGHFEEALFDYSKAKYLDPEYSLTDLGMGTVFLDRQWYKTSEVYLSYFLNESPDHIVALTSLARSVAGQGRGAEAAALYMRVSGMVKKPSPEFYIEMADFYLIAADYSQAIKSLDMGIERLGRITSLDQKALEIELQNKLIPNAIIRLDSLIEYSPQKERWLYQKGQLLESQGSYEEAKKSYLEGLNYYNSRPPNRRRIQVLAEIKVNIEKALDRVNEKL